MKSIERMWTSLCDSLTTWGLFALACVFVLLITSCLWAPGVAVVVWIIKQF